MGYWGFFSEREDKIIKILGRKKMTYNNIAQELFAHPLPLDAEINIGNSIRRIIKKCEHHGLLWTLTKKKINGKLVVFKERI